MFIKAGIHHRNVYVKKYHKLAHLITHKMAWSFQRQASVISIKTVNNMPLPIIGVWEKIIYYARRNCQIFLHVRAPGGGARAPVFQSWRRNEWDNHLVESAVIPPTNQPTDGRPWRQRCLSRCPSKFSGSRCEMVLTEATSKQPSPGRPGAGTEQDSSSSPLLGIHVYIAAAVAAVLVVCAVIIAVCFARKYRQQRCVTGTRCVTTD